MSEKKPQQPWNAVEEVFITNQAWGSEKKPTLVISIDALAEILYNEAGVIAPQDVPAVLCALHGYAAPNKGSTKDGLDAWDKEVVALEGNEDEDEEEDEE